MNVLSLFNGLGGSVESFKVANVKFNKIFTSEIDKDAMFIADKNYPEGVKYKLGDITTIDLKKLPKIDVIMAGSPCQGFSRSGKGLNFEDTRSKLFFNFVDILNWVKVNNNKNVKFLLENVSMKKENCKKIIICL